MSMMDIIKRPIMETAKFFRLLVLTVCIIAVYVPGSALAASDVQEPLNVRVGYFEFKGYHEQDENGVRSGYGYDFLQLLARHENIVYTYCGYGSSWDELIDMLDRGEIDMLTLADKTDERCEKFSFSEQAIGSGSTMLTVKAGNTRVVSGDYSTYNGLTVGMYRGSSRNNSFKQLSIDKGFSYIPVYYDSVADMLDALQTGEVDAAVTASLRVLKNEQVIETFDKTYFYAMVKKGNDRLLSLINDGIEKMDLYEPTWEIELTNRYYSNDLLEYLNLTKAEIDYLDSLKREGHVFKVLVNPDRYPYSWFEDGKALGIMPELFEKIAGQYGIRYEYIVTQGRPEYIRAIADRTADICIDFHDDFYIAEKNGYKLTDTYLEAAFSWIQRKGFYGKMETIVTVGPASAPTTVIPKLVGDAAVIFFDSAEECLNAVREGKADGYYTFTYQAERAVFDDNTHELKTALTSYTTKFNLGVRETLGCELLTILNKGVKSLNEADIDAAVMHNTDFGEHRFSVIRMFYDYPELVIFIAITLLIVIVLVMRAHVQQMYRVRLKAALARAEEASQAKTRFLTNMSHDIRTPMNAIVGLAEIAEMSDEDPEDLKRSLRQIKSASGQLLSIINDVLDMSAIESGKFFIKNEPFNIIDESTGVFDIIRTQAEARGLKMKVDSSDITHVNLIGDAKHIDRVILNLLNNAVKFNKPGGEVRVLLKELESRLEGGATFMVKISDDGIGMSREFLSQVFKPFERERSSTVSMIEGTGLGLSITKNIMDMLGGTIDIESEKGVGTTITVIFSLKINDGGQSQNDAGGSLRDSFEGHAVMLVDDNDINLEIAARVFNMLGLEVKCFSDGTEAVDAMQEDTCRSYDLIFMDIMMPGMDGLEATRQIRNIGTDYAKNIPIIAMTANAFEDDRRNALEAGMDEHIAKPFDVKQICRILNMYIK